MHIMLEGTVPMETKLLLKQCIVDNDYFSLQFLNERLRCFPFSQEEIRDKPTPISPKALEGGSLQQSGMFWHGSYW